MKKLLSIAVLAFAVIGLAACSSKDANGIPNKLQDKYVGHSENPGYDGLIFLREVVLSLR